MMEIFKIKIMFSVSFLCKNFYYFYYFYCIIFINLLKFLYVENIQI